MVIFIDSLQQHAQMIMIIGWGKYIWIHDCIKDAIQFIRESFKWKIEPHLIFSFISIENQLLSHHSDFIFFLGRAIQFQDSCSTVSYDSLLEEVFPTDSNAEWFAKHLYRVITGHWAIWNHLSTTCLLLYFKLWDSIMKIC